MVSEQALIQNSRKIHFVEDQISFGISQTFSGWDMPKPTLDREDPGGVTKVFSSKDTIYE